MGQFGCYAVRHPCSIELPVRRASELLKRQLGKGSDFKTFLRLADLYIETCGWTEAREQLDLAASFLWRIQAEARESDRRVIRIDADDLPALLDGLFVALLQAKGPSPTPQGNFPVLGLLLLPAFIRLVVFRDRLAIALLVREKIAKAVAGPGVLRINVDGLLELPGRLIVVLLRAERPRPVAQRMRISDRGAPI